MTTLLEPAVVVLEHPDDQAHYPARWVRFVRVPEHAQAYRAAYEDQSGSSANELRRIRREYETLPPRHDCSCSAWNCYEYKRRGACPECSKIRNAEVLKPEPVEFLSRRPAESRMPPAEWLDLERALSALGDRESAQNVARWLSGEW